MSTDRELELNPEAPAAEASSEAHWWGRSISRRDAHRVGLSVTALAALAGCDSSKVVDMDALAAQKKGGWDVGDKGLSFPMPNVAGKDSLGNTDWQKYTNPQPLLAATTPKDPQHKKWQMPTLVQALEQKSLAVKMKPVSSAASQEAYRRARALGSLVGAMENKQEAIVIADLDGANSPAAAAGMAAWVDPVFFYDNWPHPKGVVHSQTTLGSLIYYAAELEKKAAERDEKAPPAIMLDRKRLATYNSPNTQFDNRYLVTLPEVKDLTAAGIKYAIYVTDVPTTTETDDLNEQLVAYDKAGIEVVNLSLADFKKDAEHTADANDPTGGYYYGGHHRHHTHFFMWYPFFIWSSPRYGWTAPARSVAPTTARRSSYKPRTRPTMYSGRKTGGVSGVGRSKPVGFGKVSTRQSSSGSITGTRSGSTGRFRSSSSFGG